MEMEPPPQALLTAQAPLFQQPLCQLVGMNTSVVLKLVVFFPGQGLGATRRDVTGLGGLFKIFFASST